MKKYVLLGSLLFSICFLVCIRASAQEETVPEVTLALPTAPVPSPESQEILRSNLRLQEQLHTAILAIERSRQDAENASQKNAQLFTERLNAVEKNLATQRERDLETMVSMRESNRATLIAAAILAGIGALALVLTGYFQVRAMNRIAEVGTLFSTNLSLDSSRALGEGNLNLPARLNSAEQSSARLLATIEQLEKRILELDSANSNSRAPVENKINLPGETPNVGLNGSDRPESGGEAPTTVESLLHQGQSLLNSSDAEKAQACFEEALLLDPKNTEALVKKGSALELLRRLPEAIETYDLAIAVDNSLTVAYLYKGGVLNRLQRFNEAMECYEQALRTHPKQAA